MPTVSETRATEELASLIGTNRVTGLNPVWEKRRIRSGRILPTHRPSLFGLLAAAYEFRPSGRSYTKEEGERCAESGTFPTRFDSDGQAVSMTVR